MRSNRPGLRFSIRDLVLVVTVYAIFFAAFSSVPAYVSQWVAGTAVITLFVAGDLLRNRQTKAIPIRAAATFRISLYSTAMALAAVAFLLVYSNTPPESKPPVAFGLYELFSGEALDEFARALATVLGIVLGGWLFARLATAVAPGGTLLVVGHHPNHADSAHAGMLDMFYPAEEVAAALDPADWEVAVAETRSRLGQHPDGSGETTFHDAVLRAVRRPTPAAAR